MFGPFRAIAEMTEEMDSWGKRFIKDKDGIDCVLLAYFTESAEFPRDFSSAGHYRLKFCVFPYSHKHLLYLDKKETLPGKG